MTTKAATTTFDSAAVPVPDRPTATVTIAGRDYQMRCPKLRVWMAIIERQEDYEAGQSLKPHIQDIYRKLSNNPGEEDRAKLIEQYGVLQPTFSQAPTALQLADLLLDFLCSCMIERTDAEHLRGSYSSDDGACDIPHLRIALDDMDETFSAWLDEQADFVGVLRPELPQPRQVPANRASRRAASTKNGSGKRTPTSVG